ncbi:hypothetical protein EHEL_100500 [Encephalitozoon hellem ATCC 50504]|uniref:Importin subunit beta-4 n=1 Tax=Encephalitozoon hellem TaxID=27973 RepID=A0A9Q9C4R3_ENCHE|nr:uncharacterized protein EHEL_100500 [Encephalitozoon hellem ATCC 50504]AFM99143.1 hypothetical protein EHEL_100500 [Encephalitozoon hellem ATCC 50504]UTX44129.1 importin subunit beta-4 [Encephalitozoon hellem]|eukprot:XP_003888124.1 hypothetical protein EHEL_100500 [Encephalitozoon hellem ATCC 50504]
MSLKDQLLKLKKCRRAIHSGHKGRVRFGDTEDMDDEMILDLVPIQTPYTGARSLSFDRQRQTEEKEERFNRKFSKFLKELVRHGNTNDIEYLFDYLVRRYQCDTFNSKEMIFFLLPFTKYYEHVLHLSRISDFNYFSVQPTYSYQFIGNLCLREKYFFDFFVEYFEHFKYIREFCLNVLGYVISGMKNADKDFSMQFFEIISHLVRLEENDTAVKVFFDIRDHVEEVIDEFVELLEPHFSKEYLISRRPKNVEHKISIPREEAVLFRNMYDSEDDRRILGDSSRYKNYVIWLHREGLALKSFSEPEFEALKVLCGIEDKRIDGDISIYANLFKELRDRRGLIELLNYSFREDILALTPYMGDDDKAYLSQLSPRLWESVITENNYAMVLTNMPRRAIKEDLRKIMKVCLGYVKYEGSVFTEYLDENVLFALMEECLEDIPAKNIIDTARFMGIDLTSIIVEKGFYTNPIYLNHLSEEPRSLKVEMSRKIFEDIMKLPSKACIDALCRYVRQIDDRKLINDVLGCLIEKGFSNPSFYSALASHIEVLSEENCERILDLRGFSKENHCIVDRLYRYRESVAAECLAEKHYDALLFLCKGYGFSKVLGNRSDENMIDFIEVLSKQNLPLEEAEEFIRYSFSLIKFGGERIVKALFQDRYVPHLIKCSMLREWKTIKAMAIELIVEHNQHRQFCFDYFLDNYHDFKNDFDLLDVIARDGITIDYGKLLEVLKGSESYFKSSFSDILLRNLSFDSLRFVPVIVPSMIEHKKESVRILFKEHGNIMSPYVKDILLKFPEIEECMFEIDSRHLLIGSIKAYTDAPNDHHLDFMCRALDLSDTSLSLPILKRVAGFLDANVSRVKDKLFTKFFGTYLKACPEADESIRSLLKTLYESNRDVFFEVSKVSLPLCYKIFRPYADFMIGMVKEKDRNAITFITEYLHWDLEYCIPHRKLFEMLFGFYCNEPDILYAKCISSILRHNPKEIEDANDLILSKMKGDKAVMILELLQVLYQKVHHFKKCLVKSSPYFALVVDSTRKDISSAARKLLNIIERKHNKGGYQLLQL